MMKDELRVAVIMPSKGRPAQLERNAGALLLQELPEGVEHLVLVLAVECGDIVTLSVARKLQTMWQEADVSVVIVYRANDTTCVQGDDQVWQPGWLAAALATAQATGAQVIGLNDGHTNLEDYAPHFMLSAAFIEKHLGGLLVDPGYYSWWFDREICEIARQNGLYAPAWAALVDHQHPDWGTAPMDATYEAAWPTHDADKAHYLERRSLRSLWQAQAQETTRADAAMASTGSASAHLLQVQGTEVTI
jgi:hypothetical protein